MLGPEHDKVALTINNLAAVHVALVEPGEAKPLFERALAIRRKVLGPDHARVADSILGLAEVALLTEQWDIARDRAEEAIAIYEHSGSTGEVPDAQFVLARALWELGDRARGEQLARTASDALRSAGERRRSERSASEKWWDEHGVAIAHE